MSGRRLRVGLFGRLGSGNIGNDATMEAVLAYLKAEQPDADVDCLCSGPERVTERYGLPAAQMHWLTAPIRHSRWRLIRVGVTIAMVGLGCLIDTVRIAAWVRRHDVVIMPGSGVLETTLPVRPWEIPYSLFVLSAAGKVFGTKVALVCVGAAAVPERLTRWLLTKAARLARYRSFRDRQSLEAARELGMARDGDQVYPDLVFALPSPPGTAHPAVAVGVGVMAYAGVLADRPRAEEILAEYTAKMSLFVRRLIDQGDHVRLLIGDINDERVVRDVVADARSHWSGPGDVPLVYEPFSTVGELMVQLGTVDAVVGTRFHTVLAALKLAKPTLAIGYARKHVEVMNEMGVGDFVHPIRDLDVDELERQFAALRAKHEQITRTLAERSRSQRERLDDQFAELGVVLFADDAVRIR